VGKQIFSEKCCIDLLVSSQLQEIEN